MSEILKWAMGLGSLLVGYWVRKRNVGLAIMATSAGIIASQSAGNFDVEAQHVFGLVDVFKFSTSGGLDALASTVMVYLGAIGFLAGGYVVLRDWHADRKDRDSRRVAVIEFRGLVDTSDKPLASAVPARMWDGGTRFSVTCAPGSTRSLHPYKLPWMTSFSCPAT